MGRFQGEFGRSLHIRLDADAFPIGLADGIDGPGQGHDDDEMVIDAVRTDVVPPAAGGPANTVGLFQILAVLVYLLRFWKIPLVF